MGVRMTESAVAFGFGAGDALIAAKVTRPGLAGIPWPVLYEAAGVSMLFIGGKLGVPAEVRDNVGISALALAGARVTRAALAGKLAQGPRAWGGDSVGGDSGYFAGDPSAATGGGWGSRAAVRMLPGSARGGGFSLLPVTQEAPGVAG